MRSAGDDDWPFHADLKTCCRGCAAAIPTVPTSVQQTVVKSRRRRSFQPGTNFAGWLFGFNATNSFRVCAASVRP